MNDPQKRGTAEELLSPGQMVGAAALLALAAAVAVVFGPLVLLKVIMALVIAFYVVFVGLKVLLWAAAPRSVVSAGSPTNIELPTYTVLVPLHDEANVLPLLVKALSALVYPVDKLEILLLLEEDDQSTIAAARQANLPDHFRIILVPDAGPRTKPKACNYGYSVANGDRVVIFDAEDRPESDQLLRAAEGLAVNNRGARRVGCLQATLSFWNPRSGWVSTFLWGEYTTHFNWVLPGLARLRLIPPLGGTSNHFLREALDAVAIANGDWIFTDQDGREVSMRGPWDPYNVTEDADLAMRLAKAGYDIDILRGAMGYSTTYEEAPASIAVVLDQGDRWLKGYLQTALVHLRRPFRSMRQVGVRRWMAFNLFMLGTPLSLVLNPLMWGLTTLYVASRLGSLLAVTSFIEGLFPAPIYYAGMVVAVGGNLALYFQKLTTPLFAEGRAEQKPEESHDHAKFQHEQEYGLVWRLFFAPLWWACRSVSAYRALFELLVPSKRSSWCKTPHGHDLATEAQIN